MKNRRKTSIICIRAKVKSPSQGREQGEDEILVLRKVKMDYSYLRNGTDVRGIASEGVEGETVDLTEEIAEKIAGAFCLWLQKKTGKSKVKIAVGHDSRISASALEKGIVAGITGTGNDAVRTGLSSTPSMFMLLQKPERETDGSVMITASHLPFNRNGLKFFTKEAGLEGAEVAEILSIAGTDFEKNAKKYTLRHMKEY